MKVLTSKGTIVSLDKKDRAIISELSTNARLPLTAIAKKVMLSRKSVEYRIEQMENKSIISGYRTVINIKRLGFQTYHIFITPQNQQDEKELIERAIRSPFVNAVVTYSGKFSAEISIMARNPEEFQGYSRKLFSGINVREDITLMLLNTIKSSVIPGWQKRKIEKITAKENKNYTLDDKDIELLKIISKDSTITSLALAEKLKISKDTVAYRIKSLIESKFIVEFRPAINFSALGYSINSILLKINKGNDSSEKFESYLKESDNVLWSTKTFGEYDYVIYLMTKDVSELHVFIDTAKTEFNNLISSYELLFAYEELKYEFMADSVSTIK